MTDTETREVVVAGWDGQSQPIHVFRDELHLPRHLQDTAGARAAATNPERQFDVIKRRRWTLIAEWLGSREDGQRTARWFMDNETGELFAAESWKRANLSHPLDDEQTAFVRRLVPELAS